MNAFSFTQRFSARFIAVLALFSLVAGSLPLQAFAGDADTDAADGKVFICHANKNAGYDDGKKEVAIESILNAHNDHSDGGPDGRGDIIPSFTYTEGAGPSAVQAEYPGKNWDAAGKAIYGAGCETASITNPNPGADSKVITVNKTLVNAPAGVDESDFTFSVQGKDVAFEADGSNDVDASLGTYMVTEKNASAGTIKVAGNDYNVSYGPGCEGTLTKDSTVSCTITNTYVSPTATDKDVISVVKTLVNAPTGVTADDFTFSVQGKDVAFEADGSNDVDVTLGTYAVTEKNATAGTITFDGKTYNVTYSDGCDGTLTKDSNEICTITNTLASTTNNGGTDKDVVTVVKTLVNAPAGVTADDFSLRVGGVNIGFEADGSNDVDVLLGNYLVTEPGETSGVITVEGKTFNVSYSDGCEGVLTKDSNETCTITNTFISPTADLDVISVVKTLVNAPLGVTTDDFKFSVQGKDIMFETDGSNDVDVVLGSYAVKEKTEFNGIVHVDGNQYAVTYSPSCTGTLTEESNATCTITNTFVSDTPVMNTCVLPDSEGDADDITFGETYDPSGTQLQDVLNDYGYGYVDAKTDDVNTQVWNFASSSTGSTTFKIKVLAKIALNNQLFGYYKENNPGSFVPLFEVGAHSQTVVPNVAVGSTIQVTIPSNASFGFALNTEGLNNNTWYSQEALNIGGKDNLAVYNPSTNKYILAFEDLREENEDDDYQDLVLELSLVECVSQNGGGDTGGGQVLGDFVSMCPLSTPNLLANASFEDPVVSSDFSYGGGFYEFFDSIPSWIAANGIELWRNVFGGGSSGPQNAELDVNNTDNLSQTVTTIPGATYELRFDLAAKVMGGVSDNYQVIASADGSTVVNTNATSSQWRTVGGTFVANDASTDIGVGITGVSNATGKEIDNAVLCLVTNPNPNPQPLACTVNVHGDTSTQVNASGAIVVTDQPSVWVDNIVGSMAQWIWSVVSGGPADPTNNETEVFTKTFDWNGPVTDAKLKISADNTYSVVLNGEEVASSTNEDNFTTTDVIDLDGFIDQGTNTLTISVTNTFNGGTTTASTAGQNPAGLLYDLTVVGNNTTDCTPDGNGGGGNPNVLSCAISASDTTVRRGNDVTLTFDSNLATTASIDNGIGNVPVDGSRLVENLRDDTTYTLTAANGNATTTCAVSVDTRSGGGGGGGSRNSNNNNNNNNDNNNGGGNVLGASDDNNSNDSNDDDSGFGSVLGEQVSLLPEGAPNAGAGGAAPITFSNSVAPVAFTRRSLLG